MIVKVDALNSYDKGVIDWLHRIPQEVQYNPTTEGVTYKGVFYPNVKDCRAAGSAMRFMMVATSARVMFLFGPKE